MPPKQKFNKEMILEAALKITRETGFEAVNARSLATVLGCSTAPIYTYYSTMDELKTELYDFAVNQFMDKVNSHKDDTDFLEYANRIFIQTALLDSNLFRFIYLSHSCDGESLYDLLTKYESNRLILERLCSDYSLPSELGRDVFYKIWFLVFGVSSLISTNQVKTTEQEIFNIVSEAVGAILRDVKNK